VAVRLFQVDTLVAGLEGKQQVAAGSQYSVELGEDHRPPFRRGVDDGVLRDVAAEEAVRQVKVQHRTFFESQVRGILTGHRNHHRRQIDAEGTQPERVQVCRNPTRATTKTVS
jgi:hypothetical protein